ncbi:MAG: calcium-binding protein [Thermoguttaceae bacterium]
MKNCPLPKVEIEWLRKYFAFLTNKLAFPFPAHYTEENSIYQPPSYLSVEVIELIEPENKHKQTFFGLFCRARKADGEIEVPLVDLEVKDDNPNFQYLEDYWYWIWNWRFDPRI